uniref:Nudix hydrolase domain-containing protein n=1 Tax=viral metagenome TaxID=1070528 RepID=A0A6C0DQC4_9ZZZZ
MVAGSILPVTIHNNEIYFLFGKENNMEKSAKGWSDFGGGVENGETPFKTALREGSEELTGFLGDSKQLAKHIKTHGGFYHIEHNNYHVHIIFWDYDENLVKYYNNNHAFLWERMDNQMLSKSKLFEKIEIGWFSLNDIKNNRGKFRMFYEEIVDKILENVENIREFINKKNRRKTVKSRKYV